MEIFNLLTKLGRAFFRGGIIGLALGVIITIGLAVLAIKFLPVGFFAFIGYVIFISLLFTLIIPVTIFLGEFTGIFRVFRKGKTTTAITVVDSNIPEQTMKED